MSEFGGTRDAQRVNSNFSDGQCQIAPIAFRALENVTRRRIAAEYLPEIENLCRVEGNLEFRRERFMRSCLRRGQTPLAQDEAAYRAHMQFRFIVHGVHVVHGEIIRCARMTLGTIRE